MDITPHVNLLRSLRGERINYVLLIGEGVDNAFDAGAKNISVEISRAEVGFSDDGVGITRDRIASLFSLGDHGPMSTTQLGRFGIGIKSQAVNAGNVLAIESTSRDGRMRIEVDWRNILASGRWSIDDPHWRPVGVGTPTGTAITISKLRHAPKVGIDKIRYEVAQRFHPAIAEGKTISLNGEPVPLLAEPPMTDVIELQLMLSGDRSAHLRAGILAAPSTLNRVHVAYRHRVIMPASALGCGEYGGLNKMFARLQLSGPWHLAKFKDDLTDEAEREELEERVEDALRPILEKVNTASMIGRIIEFSQAINDLVSEEFAVARPRRTAAPADRPDRKRVNQPGEVAEDKSDPGGPAKSKRPPRDQLLITFDGVADQHGIGFYQGDGKVKRVNLSRDDPHIALLLEHRDREIGVRSLYAIAICLFEQGRSANRLESDEPFGRRIAKMLAAQPAEQERAA